MTDQSTCSGDRLPNRLTGTAWDVPMHTGRVGTGNWDAYNLGLEPIYAAAEKWRQAISGIDYPWLCWNIDDEWCQLQQKLIMEVGWVPVIGWDSNSCPSQRTILPGAIEIDFNKDFQFPAMWPHFPLEFAFLWADRLAFWHADLLVRMDKMKVLAESFRNLPDNEMYAVPPTWGLRRVLNFWRGDYQDRYWELIGCTTKGASRNQFETGCGWWRHFYKHPNTPPTDAENRSRYYYDSGVGILYWKKYCGGVVHDIPISLVEEGHCSQIGSKNYHKANNKSEELRLNFNLLATAKRLGLEAYLEPVKK